MTRERPASVPSLVLMACLWAWGALWPGVVQAAEGQGFAELRLSSFPGADGDLWQVVERVRPTLETSLGERVKLVAVIEAGLAQGRDNERELRRIFETVGCTSPRPDNDFLGISSADDYLDVDRLYLDFYGKGVDLRVGRQSVNWGSARFLNPTDPFPELLLTEPWRPRRGVNAARATLPFGDLHDATLVVASDDAFTQVRTAARVRLNAWATDWALVGAWRSDDEDAFVGVDFRGTLGVGWWVEAAWHLTGERDVEASAGVDYSFPVLERLVVTAQYTFHGGSRADAVPGGSAGTSAGTLPASACSSSALQASLAGTGEAAPFASPLTGRNYLLLAAALQVLPDWGGSLTQLQNVDDGTAVLIPTVSWQAADWLEVAMAAQVPLAVWGDGGELKPKDQHLVPTTGGLATLLDLRGLVPDAVVTLWTRASF